MTQYQNEVLKRHDVEQPQPVPNIKLGAAKYQNEVLNEREKTHGDYEVTAQIAQELKYALGKEGRTLVLPAVQRESLDLICTKLARIISGDNNCKDSWDDIAGYANLVSERLK